MAADDGDSDDLELNLADQSSAATVFNPREANKKRKRILNDDVKRGRKRKKYQHAGRTPNGSQLSERRLSFPGKEEAMKDGHFRRKSEAKDEASPISSTHQARMSKGNNHSKDSTPSISTQRSREMASERQSKAADGAIAKVQAQVWQFHPPLPNIRKEVPCGPTHKPLSLRKQGFWTDDDGAAKEVDYFAEGTTWEQLGLAERLARQIHDRCGLILPTKVQRKVREMPVIPQVIIIIIISCDCNNHGAPFDGTGHTKAHCWERCSSQCPNGHGQNDGVHCPHCE